MELDDELCLCFHVTRRKIENFVRVEKPRAPSQIAECFGAGTGCGWCRPYLRQLWENARGRGDVVPLPTPEEYAQGRGGYVQAGKGKPPPGATPLPENAGPEVLDT
jgi:bacterioferritin-associated ferredoxin